MPNLRLVQNPHITPARCAVTGHAGGPLIDTGITSPVLRPHIYVSPDGAIKLGRFVGMADPEEIAAKDERIAELEARVAELEGIEAEHKRLRDSVEYTLKGFGQHIHAKPGPKSA